MNALWLTIKGMLMGISNMIPGVSGGTMAVSLGIYDDLIFAITRLFKEKKKSIKFLAPLGLGLVLGIIFFFLCDRVSFGRVCLYYVFGFCRFNPRWLAYSF